ncbi:hypothetical protein ABHI18_004542 [Aspergillus niger]
MLSRSTCLVQLYAFDRPQPHRTTKLDNDPTYLQSYNRLSKHRAEVLLASAALILNFGSPGCKWILSRIDRRALNVKVTASAREGSTWRLFSVWAIPPSMSVSCSL